MNLRILSALMPFLVLNTQTNVCASRIDCHPLDGANEESCKALGCVWSPVHEGHQHSSGIGELSFDHSTNHLVQGGFPSKSAISAAWCHFPDQYEGYKIVERSSNGNRVKLLRQRPSGVPNDISELFVDFETFDSSDTLLRIRIHDAKQKRFEPELPSLRSSQLEDNTKVETQFSYEVDQAGNLVVKRKATGATLFKTDLGKLIFADQFIQLNSKLDSPFLYGLGEHYSNFLKKASDDYKTFSFYNTDKVPLPEGRRSYGVFPFYVNLDSQNQEHAHGVYLHNSNAMDITLQPDQSVTFRPIGGILDFIFFSGPTPNDVIKQYQALVGLPDLPPRWALGFHLCRYDYKTLEKTELVWRRNRDAGIPFDVQWNDIDYMDKHNDFTYDKDKFKGLPEFIDKLHGLNMHYVILFDPGVSQEDNYYPYSLGHQMDIFVKNATNQTLIGKVWNDSGRTVFPDFSNPKSTDYWVELFKKMQEEVKFDGAWIDMNDISSFVYGSIDGCPDESLIERPPYRPGGYNLQEKSLCLSAKHKAGNEYNVHNLYSFYEAIATSKALQESRPGKRPLIISRSTSPGQGHFGGHWSGDVLSTWDYLRWSIPSLIEHSMYGYSLMGSDICGFVGNTNAELCARWSTLGAFYTFARNHNDDVSIDQDPVALGDVVVEANKNALKKRYSLLPYLYTLIHRAHRFGEPAVRSVPFEFYTTDPEALKVEYQFMWGKGLMISPVVEQNSRTKSTYLPAGRWYETNVKPNADGSFDRSKWIDSKGEWYETKDIELTDIPIFYRGGHIVPIYKEVRSTTVETADQPIGLEVSLCPQSRAQGDLFLDEGDNTDGKYNHLTMSFFSNELSVTLDHSDFKPTVEFGFVKVRGYAYNLTGIIANNKPVSFARDQHEISFDLNNVSVAQNDPLTIQFY